jgi:hypothetical protein
MKLLIFQTNIDSKHHLDVVSSVFKKHSAIIDWSVDTEDIDKVLRIEATENLYEKDVITMLDANGLYCNELAG